MLTWIAGLAATALWGAAIYFTLRSFNRNSRTSLRAKIDQEIHEMWNSPEEIALRAQAEPDNAAVAIRHAANAHGDWPEMIKRAKAVSERFPHLVHGRMLLVRAHWEMGEIDQARRLLQPALRRFPHDAEVMEVAILVARRREDWREVARRARYMHRIHLTHTGAYIHEITARLRLGDEKRAAVALKRAEYEFELRPDEYTKVLNCYVEELSKRPGATPLPPPQLGEEALTVHEEAH